MKSLFRTVSAFLMVAGLAAAAMAAESAKTPSAGDKAPLIQGKDQDGKTFNLADHIGKKIVLLYFYPQDDTKGCTAQACGLRDRMSELNKENVEVVGVSFDDAESHQKFIAKHHLNFTLLATPMGKSPMLMAF